MFYYKKYKEMLRRWENKEKDVRKFKTLYTETFLALTKVASNYFLTRNFELNLCLGHTKPLLEDLGRKLFL